MSAFETAWHAWLSYSLAGFFFSILTWRYMRFISLLYVVGGMIIVFTKYSDPATFGVTEEVWRNLEYWKEVRGYILFGQMILTVAVISIELGIDHLLKRIATQDDKSNRLYPK